MPPGVFEVCSGATGFHGLMRRKDYNSRIAGAMQDLLQNLDRRLPHPGRRTGSLRGCEQRRGSNRS